MVILLYKFEAMLIYRHTSLWKWHPSVSRIQPFLVPLEVSAPSICRKLEKLEDGDNRIYSSFYTHARNRPNKRVEGTLNNTSTKRTFGQSLWPTALSTESSSRLNKFIYIPAIRGHMLRQLVVCVSFSVHLQSDCDNYERPRSSQTSPIVLYQWPNVAKLILFNAIGDSRLYNSFINQGSVTCFCWHNNLIISVLFCSSALKSAYQSTYALHTASISLTV